ncbi:MAG: transglutaminase family protein [Blastochloris sp.]|nr:transglutaminase family protein [Blastochloris sp.]
MRFRIVHHTEYQYRHPASESYAELRICPQSSLSQRVIKRRLELTPATAVDEYEDFLGNKVEYFSIPYRHKRLVVRASAEVETQAYEPPQEVLSISIAEAQQIYRSQMLTLHPFLQATPYVPLHKVLRPLRKNFLKSSEPIGQAVLHLNQWIFQTFKYKPGTTDISTPLSEVIKRKRGVCQDFAHLMLCILRTYGLPARYVSGYIEAYDPTVSDPALVGATASHAWVEVCLPGGTWWGLDPTNNQTAGERHVVVAYGRDYRDAAPLKGTYKGAQDQQLEVMVSVKRKKSN